MMDIKIDNYMHPHIFDQSSTQMDSLHMEHFFDYPYLVELNLSNNQLWSLPLSISNCILLEHVDISNNPMSRPPAVLFSLPKLRTNPQNIIFGRNQVCTDKLAREIMNESANLNHCMFNFKEFDNSSRLVSFPPETTTLGLFQMLHPEALHLADYFVLVRTYKTYTLRIIPEEVPASLYFMPNAIWSFEIKYLPPSIPISILPLVRQYVVDQANIFKNDEKLTQLVQEIKQFKESDSSQLYNLLRNLESSPYLCSRHFTAQLITSGSPRQIQITANAEGVSMSFSPSMYFTFNPRTISFDYIKDASSNTEYHLLMCGNRALTISKESVSGLMTLFSYTTPEMEIPPKKSRKRFLEFAAKQIPKFLSGKDPRLFISDRLINPDDMDDKLNELRKFEGHVVRFVDDKSPKFVTRSKRAYSVMVKKKL
ncbi:hypothetical protein TRFO_32355 [Tritrichomonas foetus]|uniref:Leucine Rich Repeat family protein n=1 Tax=Tritrichomonas foetus TaxID=1144522 RepID=A0A1J4JQ59_9EUKA|nr:hypothetical protein TRFO_32355 [Tritrichomonas foetus]|eukprot:OHT00882.1 hypothetical protein TRFO_32355 [Tritrichomonas foetus]